MHQFHVTISFSECEVCNSLLVEAHIPAHLNAFLSLGLLEPLVIVGFKLHQWTKNVLVLITILISVKKV